jgi:hypothetical protein
MHWSRLSKTGGGYCVRACDPEYRHDDDDKEAHVEPWEISVDLIGCIASYYKKHPHEGVQVVEKESEKETIDELKEDDSTTDSE